jgi:hypothetical protein
MWRSKSYHKKQETEFLDDAIRRIQSDTLLNNKAEAKINEHMQIPAMRRLFECPQSPTYHSEGPFVNDHIRLMLIAIYAIVEGKLHLTDIEEFRREKHLLGEIDELEEIIKENAATFEVFALCHDLGKPITITFDTKKGSKGERLGISSSPSKAWSRYSDTNREELINLFSDTFNEFAKNMKEGSEQIQKMFYLEYQIDVHYPGHAHAIFSSELKDCFAQIADAHRLSTDDKRELIQMISLHMQALYSFSESVNIPAFQHLIKEAHMHGRDADDFLDCLQAAVFLDVACGSLCRSPHGTWHDTSTILNFIKSEYENMPERFKQNVNRTQLRVQKSRLNALKNAGLDGDSLLGLINQKPGPEFGVLLNQIQEYAAGQNLLPEFEEEVHNELIKRVERFRKNYPESIPHSVNKGVIFK